MVTDALKRLREIFAFGLMTVAALYLVSGLSLLLKSERDAGFDFAGGLDFAGKSAAFGYLFASPVLIFCVVAAVAIVAFGTPTEHARIVALIGLAIAGVALMLAAITWLAGLAGAATDGLGLAGGVLGAGKIVGSLLGLAQLLLLALATWFSFAVFSVLPKAAPQTSSWSQAQGYGAPTPSGQAPWSQQEGGYVQPQAWGPSVQSQWQPDQPPGGPVAGATAAGWAMPEQGQPASAWVSADQTYGASSSQEQHSLATGDPHPPQWYPETTATGQWHNPQASAPQGRQQQWTQPEPEAKAAPEGGQRQWAQPEQGTPPVIFEPPPGSGSTSEPDPVPEPRGSTAADVVGSRGDLAEEPEVGTEEKQEQEHGVQQRHGWWQRPER